MEEDGDEAYFNESDDDDEDEGPRPIAATEGAAIGPHQANGGASGKTKTGRGGGGGAFSKVSYRVFSGFYLKKVDRSRSSACYQLRK